jgi:hypothetical protein
VLWVDNGALSAFSAQQTLGWQPGGGGVVAPRSLHRGRRQREKRHDMADHRGNCESLNNALHKYVCRNTKKQSSLFLSDAAGLFQCLIIFNDQPFPKHAINCIIYIVQMTFEHPTQGCCNQVCVTLLLLSPAWITPS